MGRKISLSHNLLIIFDSPTSNNQQLPWQTLRYVPTRNFNTMVTIYLLFVAGICYGVQWHLQFRVHYWGKLYERASSDKYAKWRSVRFVSPLTVFWWYDPEDISWRNKYKGRRYSQGPAFPGSTWLLVFLTDAFHFFQMLSGVFTALAAVYYDMTLPAWAPLPLHAAVWVAIFRTGFTISFNGLDFIFEPAILRQKLQSLMNKITAIVNRLTKFHTSIVATILVYNALFFLAFLALVGLTEFTRMLGGENWVNAFLIIVFATIFAFVGRGIYRTWHM